MVYTCPDNAKFYSIHEADDYCISNNLDEDEVTEENDDTYILCIDHLNKGRYAPIYSSSEIANMYRTKKGKAKIYDTDRIPTNQEVAEHYMKKHLPNFVEVKKEPVDEVKYPNSVFKQYKIINHGYYGWVN